jgi:hypothetical protein
LALRAFFCAGFLAAPVLAQGYDTMASAPDPTDFVKHTDTGLTLLGTPLRGGGSVGDTCGHRRLRFVPGTIGGEIQR